MSNQNSSKSTVNIANVASQTAQFINSNGVSWSTTNGSGIIASVVAGGGVNAGVSNLGNTAGSTGTVSTGNFVLVGFGSKERAAAANDWMMNDGLIPRLVAGYGLPEHLRITVGTEPEVKAKDCNYNVANLSMATLTTLYVGTSVLGLGDANT